MSKEKQNQLCSSVEERSCIYSLLSEVYREEPGKQLLQQLKDLRYFNIPSTSIDKFAEQLALEYTRLFFGPGRHIYPYESAYRDPSTGLASKVGIQIKQLIQSCGLNFRSNFSDQPDHISVELELMARLARAQLEAWENNQPLKARELLEFELRFIQEHLLQWVPNFCDQVIKQTAASFYREIAKLTKSYISFSSREIKRIFSLTETLSVV